MKPSAAPAPRFLTVAFTGHRTLADPRVVADALRVAVDRLVGIGGSLVGVSSAASGSDTLFAEELARRGCPFSLILPFPCERFERDFAPHPGAWDRARKLMTQAMAVEVIRPLVADASATCVPPTPPPSARDQDPETAAYMDAGYLTIDRADVVLAVWDGRPGKGFGGTADAVAYARALERPLIVIDPATGRTLDERMQPLIDARAASPSNATSADASRAFADPRAEVDRRQKSADAIASEQGPRARSLATISLQLFLIASALGFFKLIFATHGPIGWMFTTASVGALVAGTVLMHKFGKSHGRWLERRVEAEICRSFLATWDIRRHATLSHQPRPPVPGMRKLFDELRMLREMDRSPQVGMDEAKSLYNTARVNDQIDHFAGRLHRARRRLFLMKIGMTTCTIAALILETATLFASDGVGERKHWMEFFGVTLPLVSTSLGVLIITLEAARRAARYTEMLDELRALQRRLLASYTWDALARVVTDIEAELIEELVEWRSFIRFTRDVAHH